MATVEVRDVSGKVLEERELPAELFDGPINGPVMHQVVTAGMAAQRAGTHDTKTRAEVRGGGRKPWRQKGTGRARHGSSRSPIWAGGGVAHGPKPRDYSIRVNKKMRKAALRSALADAAQSGKLSVVDGLAFDAPKTRDAVSVLDALGLPGKVLVVLAAPDEAAEKSFANVERVKVDFPGNLSTFDLVYADHVLFTTEGLNALTGEAWERSETEGAPEATDEPEEAPDEVPDDEEAEG
jgi:large subunit ribosomal protein L4